MAHNGVPGHDHSQCGATGGECYSLYKYVKSRQEETGGGEKHLCLSLLPNFLALSFADLLCFVSRHSEIDKDHVRCLNEIVNRSVQKVFKAFDNRGDKSDVRHFPSFLPSMPTQTLTFPLHASSASSRTLMSS